MGSQGGLEQLQGKQPQSSIILQADAEGERRRVKETQGFARGGGREGLAARKWGKKSTAGSTLSTSQPAP